MVTVMIQVPAALATEINAIALAQGFPNGKAFVISFLRGIVRNKRRADALKNVAQVAEQQADQETAAIS